MADIFNKEALEALDDHGEDQEMARVASPKLRLVLAAMVALIVVVLFWCFFGTINYKVTAQGVVFPFDEVTSVCAPCDGTVYRCITKHGKKVSYGTPVVEISMSDSISTVAAPRDGVVLATLRPGTSIHAGEPVAWFLPHSESKTGREMLCFVTYEDLRDLRMGQKAQVTPANRERERWGYALGTVVGVEQYPTSRQEIVNRMKLDPLAAFIEDGQAVYEVRIKLDEKDGKLVWSREKSKDIKIDNASLCDIQIITSKKKVWRVLVGAIDNATQSAMGN
jgi:biotin carboxyl carrier protein